MLSVNVAVSSAVPYPRGKTGFIVMSGLVKETPVDAELCIFSVVVLWYSFDGAAMEILGASPGTTVARGAEV